jgi:hypothetical protein
VVAAQLRGLGLRLWLRERRRRERVKALVAVGVAAARPRVAGAPDASRVAAGILTALALMMVQLVWPTGSATPCSSNGTWRSGDPMALQAVGKMATEMAPYFVTWTRGGDLAGSTVVSIEPSGHADAWRVAPDTLERMPVGGVDLDATELTQLRHELDALPWDGGGQGTCPRGACEVIVTGFGDHAKAMNVDNVLVRSRTWAWSPLAPAFDHLRGIYARTERHDVGAGR